MNGATWISGTTAPNDAQGVDGDFYLDTAAWNVYTKEFGAWTLIGSIKGESALGTLSGLVTDAAGGIAAVGTIVQAKYTGPAITGTTTRTVYLARASRATGAYDIKVIPGKYEVRAMTSTRSYDTVAGAAVGQRVAVGEVTNVPTLKVPVVVNATSYVTSNTVNVPIDGFSFDKVENNPAGAATATWRFDLPLVPQNAGAPGAAPTSVVSTLYGGGPTWVTMTAGYLKVNGVTEGTPFASSIDCTFVPGQPDIGTFGVNWRGTPAVATTLTNGVTPVPGVGDDPSAEKVFVTISSIALTPFPVYTDISSVKILQSIGLVLPCPDEW